MALRCVAQCGGKNSRAAHASSALPQGMPGSRGRRQGLLDLERRPDLPCAGTLHRHVERVHERDLSDPYGFGVQVAALARRA